MHGGELYIRKRRGGNRRLVRLFQRAAGKSGAVRLVPKTREGVWVIGCASPVMPLMGMLNYKDKPFDK